MQDVSGKKPHISVEPLGKCHDRKGFSCGVPALDDYLKKRAGQDARRRVAAPFVACERDSARIAGYYTLSALSIDAGALPAEMTRKLPRYPDIPATLIGRLAVDESWQGQGVGQFLLVDALYRSLLQASQIAAHAVVVDAKDASADRFYERFGFLRFPDHEGRLFLPMKTVSELFPE